MLSTRKAGLAGLFLMTLATMMYEVVLTRIFSVTMFYHFAFVAISVAMFGMTVGALVVYLAPRQFAPELVRLRLAQSALWVAVTVVLSFLVHLRLPVDPDPLSGDLVSLPLNYLVISIPFVMSGICVCVALTRFPEQVSKFYAVDLAGAALGCIAVVYLLKLTDGPTVVILVALAAALGALCFAVDSGSRGYTGGAALASLLLLGLAVANSGAVGEEFRWLRLKWVKGQVETAALYERWNSFSRVRVDGNPDALTPPISAGTSPAFRTDRRIHSLWLSIDAGAGTTITGFDGDLGELAHLKYDVTNLAHYLRSSAKVMIIGVGGGRDVLAALAFDQRAIRAVEMNDAVLDALNGTFGGFSGHLDGNSRITFVNDEARSYVARLDETFDIIQVSFIDTWAATAAGAFVLSENALYTTEGWTDFLARLSPHGVLTFSRWYFRDRPGEMYRLTSLAAAALKASGVTKPRDHIVIVRHMFRDNGSVAALGVGTILVSREPFSSDDLDNVRKFVDGMQFEMVLSPRTALDEVFATLATGRNGDAFVANFPINVAAPTDDNPFFFNMLRLRDIFQPQLVRQGITSHNMRAVRVLGFLLFVVIVLTLLCIIAPLLWTTKRGSLKGALPFCTFFGCIGFGFMFIEISQMQRLIILLGHPTYGLTVVLASLLLFSGIGSYLSRGIDLDRVGSRWIGLILLVLIVLGIATPHVIAAFQSSSTALRIGAAVGILAPSGLVIGMAFPLGIQCALRADKARLMPWLWGVNGATSVCASVVAVAIALTFGISTAFWTGVACYALAWPAFAWSDRACVMDVR